jgi:3-oxoisoapionate kinase
MTPLLCYYGDDFTGSTDVMEALASNGVDTVLFTRIPSEKEFAPFQHYSAFGLAGSSRSQTPAWMDRHLPPAFVWLKALNAKFCHYKVCSTFDSSPRVGSIGRAIEIGLSVFSQPAATLVVGAPQLKRYTFAGHLFAGYQGKTYRIDRHPVMRQHPVTPMTEADVLLHLAEQTKSKVDLIDVYDALSQRTAGEALMALQQNSLPFVVGSSGIEYALMAARDVAHKHEFPPLPAVAQTLVVSGSVSPTTERQIRYSLSHGFMGIPSNAVVLASVNNHAEIERLKGLALQALERGESPIVYSALGPSTDASIAIDQDDGARQRLGQALGEVLRYCVETRGLRRIMIAGGDTSSHALTALDIVALTTRFPLKETPGSPLCTAHSGVEALNGLEVAMKGGQLGGDDYFVRLKTGV